MQVDQCCASAAMAHALHQFPQVGTGLGGQVIAGVAQVVKMHTGQLNGLSCLDPYAAAEVPSAQRHAGKASEDEGIIIGRSAAGKVPSQVGDQSRGEDNDAAT